MFTKVYNQLANLVHRRKAHDDPSYINIIPSELLSYVLAIAIQEHDQHDQRVRELTAVMLVCTHWRDVALSTPNLWSWISMDNPLRALSWLELAKDTPLKLDVSWHYPDWFRWERSGNNTLRTLLSCIHRAHHFRFETDYSLIGDIFPRQILPAPKLSILVVEGICHDDRATLEIPSCLFTGNAPNLSEIKLSCCTTAWSSWSTLRLLTTLELIEIPLSDGPTVSQLVEILRCCPALESLRLSECLPSEDLSSPSNQVKLEVLQAIHLEDRLDSLAVLFPYLLIPVSAKIKVSNECRSSSHPFVASNSIPSLIAWVGQCSARSQEALIIPYNNGVQFLTGRTEDCVITGDFIEIDFRVGNGTQREQFLKGFLKEMGTADLTLLDISGIPDDFHESTFLDGFSRMHVLSRVNLASLGRLGVTRLLSIMLPSSASPSSPFLLPSSELLPNLSELEIYGHQGDTPMETAECESIESFLKSRTRRIKTLFLSSDCATKHGTMRLLPLVEKIRWENKPRLQHFFGDLKDTS